MHVLVAGATGYVGGRLVPELVSDGHEVRVLARSPTGARQRPWGSAVEIHEGDLLDRASLEGAFDGIEAAYYLVHSMGTGGGFADRDRLAAENFADAAQGVDRVVYLGGLQPEGDTASEHLRSRAEVGRVLRERLPTTELRAGPVIGAGSGSFEMVRYLTERLPVMVAPRWVDNEVQPIAVRDAVAYLVAALDRDPAGVVEIGSPAVLTFREMMQIYADERGLRRWITPVPVLTPYLAAQWVELVTPIPNRIAVPLIEGIVEPVVADTARARELFPEVDPAGYRQAVQLALAALHPNEAEAEGPLQQAAVDYERTDAEGLIRETWTVDVEAPPGAVFEVLSTIDAADRGVGDVTKGVRGLVDRLSGQPRLPEGSPRPGPLDPGDVVDGWRVEQIDPGRRLRLRGQTREPGRTWLEWSLADRGEHACRLTQRAIFAPRGLAGTLYRYASLPLRRRSLRQLVEAIAREAEARERRRERRTPAQA
jgi:uncharacterized protein YbjT (DUF2867 family)